jgi:small-conductance mechanosensitive channel
MTDQPQVAATTQTGTTQQPSEGGAKPGGGEPYGNLPEPARPIAAERDKAKERARAAEAERDALRAKVEEFEAAARSAAESKAKSEGDWKAVLELRDKELSELRAQHESATKMLAQLQAAERTRAVMDHVQQHVVYTAETRFAVDAAIGKLRADGMVSVPAGADAQAEAEAILDGLRKHTPSLMRRPGVTAQTPTFPAVPTTQPNGQTGIPRGTALASLLSRR